MVGLMEKASPSGVILIPSIGKAACHAHGVQGERVVVCGWDNVHGVCIAFFWALTARNAIPHRGF